MKGYGKIRPWPGMRIIVVMAMIAGAIGDMYLTGTSFANGVTIEACANGQHLRIVGDSNTDCKKNETGLSWNQQGSQGPSGPSGTNGSDGEVGATGPAGGVSTTLYTASGTLPKPIANGNVWRVFPDLSLTFNLTKTSIVQASYQITQYGQGSHLVTRVDIDGLQVVDSRKITGDTRYWGSNGVLLRELTAGPHTIQVMYRTSAAVPDNNPSALDFHSRSLQVLVFE